MTSNKNLSSPPADASFWELFDFFWARGLGNALHEDGASKPWTATLLEQAFDGAPDKRSVENWHSRANMPSPDNIRRLSWVISGGDDALRKEWHDALISARLEEKRRERQAIKLKDQIQGTQPQTVTVASSRPKGLRLPLIAALLFLSAGALIWFWSTAQSEPHVDDIRICDQHFFDQDAKKCTKHISVFVHGVDEVFLSFEFKNVPDGTPFERWWIRNGERVAGRTSFNDDAWPGYTYWRPGVLPEGQYVVRIVVDDNVFTQTFLVQADGFIADS